MDWAIQLLDLVGTAVFATTGALAAGRKRMDIFGVVVVGCVTALGGGTVRDVILGSLPVFWITDARYLAVAAIAAIIVFAVAQRRPLPATVLVYADAVGLAVFTVVGFRKGLQATQAYGLAVVMGVTTGVVGGIIRDLLAGEIPLILRREIYASASLGGAVLLALATYLELPAPLVVSASVVATLSIRLAALHWNLSLPLFRPAAHGPRPTAGESER